jgi:hypothetical protein
VTNDIGSQLARHFVTQFGRAKHPIKGPPLKHDVFEMEVEPRLREGRVAHVWVDALRFEMARELARLVEDVRASMSDLDQKSTRASSARGSLAATAEGDQPDHASSQRDH